jgi:hypothetical protein
MVSASGVGVTTAAMIRIITIAYLRLLRISLGVKKPRLATIYTSIGNWKTTPVASVNVATDEMYESILNRFWMSGLTINPAKNRIDSGVIIK